MRALGLSSLDNMTAEHPRRASLGPQLLPRLGVGSSCSYHGEREQEFTSWAWRERGKGEGERWEQEVRKSGGEAREREEREAKGEVRGIGETEHAGTGTPWSHCREEHAQHGAWKDLYDGTRHLPACSEQPSLEQCQHQPQRQPRDFPTLESPQFTAIKQPQIRLQGSGHRPTPQGW